MFSIFCLVNVMQLPGVMWNSFSMVSTAIHMIKYLQAQEESSRELSSASGLSTVKPVDTSVTLEAELEAQYINDNIQVSQFAIFLVWENYILPPFIILNSKLLEQITGRWSLLPALLCFCSHSCLIR